MIQIAIVKENHREELLTAIVNRWKWDAERAQEAFKSSLERFVNQLHPDLIWCIEYPYIDKLYRDSYYFYHSKKLASYNRDSIRVSFFLSSEPIKEEDFFSLYGQEKLQRLFLGVVTLRPTGTRILGSSHLNPKVYQRLGQLSICASLKEFTIHGAKLSTCGFPHSSQDRESYSCAETSIWALMEYYGHKYPEYTPTLPSKIISLLEEINSQRMLPSGGLSLFQLGFSLNRFGFGAFTYNESPKLPLKELATIYLRSGIPVIGGLRNSAKTIAHAVVLIGLEDPLNNTSRFIVQDDNFAPYQAIEFEKPGEHYSNLEWHSCAFEALIVPLPKKVFLEAMAAKSLFQKLINNDPSNTGRFYLASSRSYKRYISKSDLDIHWKKEIIRLELPKFVWVCEFWGGDSIVTGLALLDCTEPISDYKDPILLFTLGTNGWMRNGTKLDPFEFPNSSFTLQPYEANLMRL